MFYKTAPAFAHPVFEILPHGLNCYVVFQIGVALDNADAVTDKRVVDLHHQHTVYALATIFIPNAY